MAYANTLLTLLMQKANILQSFQPDLIYTFRGNIFAGCYVLLCSLVVKIFAQFRDEI